MKEKIEEVVKLAKSRADKAQRGHTLASLSLQAEAQTVYGHLQLLHQDLEQTTLQHAWSFAHSQAAVARLAEDARQAIEKDAEATAGAIAAVEDRTTITQ